MKKIIYLVIFLIAFHSFLYSYELLEVGDNVSVYIKKNLVKYKLESQSFSNWPEGNITFLAYDKNIDGKSPIIIFANNDYLIGVLQGKRPDAYYIFDVDGDGILDTKSQNAMLPYWVVFKNSRNKSNNDNISPIMELAYQCFQSDEGPENNPKFDQSFTNIFKFKDNINIENRDLAYLFLFYSMYSQTLPEQSLKCMQLLNDEFFKRFKKIHPIIFLYTAETLLNLGRQKEAMVVIKILRESDPHFIPAQAYEYRFETDKHKAKILLKNLKKNHPNHWIVKTL